MDMDGYISVQNKKRWQQVVKNCNFAQTTSSSYSTRNKYESYLLAKEEHDFLWGCMGKIESMPVSKALYSLAELCICHYEQVEGNSSKKNLLAPLQEMLVNSPEALLAIAKIVIEPENEELRSHALLVLRCLISKTLHHALLPAVKELKNFVKALAEYCEMYKANDAKSDDLVLAAILMLVGCSDVAPSLDDDVKKRVIKALDSTLSLHTLTTFLGKTLINRMARAPQWVLQGLDLNGILSVAQASFEAAGPVELVGLPRSLLRLISNIFRCSVAPSANALDWETTFPFFLQHLEESCPIRDSVRAFLSAFTIYNKAAESWVCSVRCFFFSFFFNSEFVFLLETWGRSVGPNRSGCGR